MKYAIEQSNLVTGTTQIIHRFRTIEECQVQLDKIHARWAATIVRCGMLSFNIENTVVKIIMIQENQSQCK